MHTKIVLVRSLIRLASCLSDLSISPRQKKHLFKKGHTPTHEYDHFYTAPKKLSLLKGKGNDSNEKYHYISNSLLYAFLFVSILYKGV